MQKPPESRRPASLVAVVLDQHGANDEHLGAEGNNAGGRHLYNAHFKFL